MVELRNNGPEARAILAKADASTAPQRLPAAAARHHAALARGLRFAEQGWSPERGRRPRSPARPSTCSTTRSCGGRRWPWPSGCSTEKATDEDRIRALYRLVLGRRRRQARPSGASVFLAEYEAAQAELDGRGRRASRRSLSPPRRSHAAKPKPQPENPDEVDQTGEPIVEPVVRAARCPHRGLARAAAGPVRLGRVPLRPDDVSRSHESVLSKESHMFVPDQIRSSRSRDARSSRSAGAGFGYLALAGLLGQAAARASGARRSRTPLAPKPPHFTPKAKRIIFLFMEGAMSQMDTLEYKPQLQKDDGKAGPGGGTLTASKFRFRQHGETGTWVSELLPAHGPPRRQALLPPRPAHRHAGPSPGRDAAAHRQRQRLAHPAVDGGLAALRAGDREPGPARATSRSTRRPTSAAP